MHVAPADFRAVRTGGVTLRFAILDQIAYVFADLPNGSAGTVVEDVCQRQHWAFVVDGSIELEIDGRREPIQAGSAFHVAAGIDHRMFAAGPTRIAGFERIEPDRDLSDERLRDDGYEILRGWPELQLEHIVPAVAPADARPPAAGAIVASGHQMGELLFARALFGPRSGYTSAWCDVPHWGMVTDGALAIEWEDDVEVLSTGDVYFCRPGPPGHRMQAADGASVVDLTPVNMLNDDVRAVSWRHDLAADALGGSRTARKSEPVDIVPIG